MLIAHVPCMPNARAIVDVTEEVTRGLDAVVLEQSASTDHIGCIRLVIDGNPVDLIRAQQNARRLGGIVDPE